MSNRPRHPAGGLRRCTVNRTSVVFPVTDASGLTSGYAYHRDDLQKGDSGQSYMIGDEARRMATAIVRLQELMGRGRIEMWRKLTSSSTKLVARRNDVALQFQMRRSMAART